jgi:antitoxin ParD1/3/4
MLRRPLTLLLEERESRLSALQAALIEGEQSGESEPFDFDDFLADKRASATTSRDQRR